MTGSINVIISSYNDMVSMNKFHQKKLCERVTKMKLPIVIVWAFYINYEYVCTRRTYLKVT